MAPCMGPLLTQSSPLASHMNEFKNDVVSREMIEGMQIGSIESLSSPSLLLLVIMPGYTA
eukprot:1159189-Pelagomonas_calceolata.AAC.6